MPRSPKREEWAGVVLGVWLLASPWVLGFSHHLAATLNALLIGTILVLGEFLALIVHEKPHRHHVRRHSGPGDTIEQDSGDREQEPLAGLS